MGFNNILETVSYIMRMLTYDNWSEAFIIVMASDTNGGLLLLLFIPAIILSVIMHGLIIANFYNTMLKNPRISNTMFYIEFVRLREIDAH